jgi:RNA polymerase-binding transcription factor DksA
MSSTAATGNQLRPVPPSPLAALRADLERQRDFRVDQLQRLAVAAARETTEPTSRPAGGVTSSLQAAARTALTEIDAALGRIAHNRYGLCESCDSAIPRERLTVLPMATMCMACQYAQELAAGDRGWDKPAMDIVDEWARDSFPASDPPANW